MPADTRDDDVPLLLRRKWVAPAGRSGSGVLPRAALPREWAGLPSGEAAECRGGRHGRHIRSIPSYPPENQHFACPGRASSHCRDGNRESLSK